MRVLFALLMMFPLLAAHAQEPGEENRLQWHAYQLAVAESPGDAFSDLLMARSMGILLAAPDADSDDETLRALNARAEVVVAQLKARVDAVRGSDPFLLGIDLGCGRGGDATVCSERRAMLESMVGDNAYHGLVLMMVAWEADDAEAFLRAARLAANAPDYESAPASGLASLVARYRQVPAPPVEHDSAITRSHGPEVMAMAISMAITLPNLGNFVRPCREADGDLRRQCLTIANRVVSRAQNLLELYIAQSVVEALGTPEDIAAAHARRREVAWLRARSLPLFMAAEIGPVAGVGDYFDTFARDGEIAAMRAFLEAHGITTTPPADWTEAMERPAGTP